MALSGPCQGRVRPVSDPCQGRVRAVSDPSGTGGKGSEQEKKGDDLGFPGTKPTSPIHYAGYTIYVCPQSSNFRVKKDGEKKDKAFSWKSCEATKTWDRVSPAIWKHAWGHARGTKGDGGCGLGRGTTELSFRQKWDRHIFGRT